VITVRLRGTIGGPVANLVCRKGLVTGRLSRVVRRGVRLRLGVVALVVLLAALARSAQIGSVAELRSQRALLAVAVVRITHAHLVHRRLRAVSSATRASHHACASAWVSKL
jgi:hypothetical protein